MEPSAIDTSVKPRVLVVDDDPVIIRLLGDILKEDYQVFFACTGETAIGIAEKNPMPDLILLDIVMREMDGYEVCQRLKLDKRTANIPIIFITAMRNEDDEAKGLSYGAVDYIVKPIRRSIVKARVKTHLELKRHRDFLEQLSSMDGLTGISNRRRFDDFIESEWHRAKREQSFLSLIMCDIDFFKRYNDNYGHAAGDICLKKVAQALQKPLKRPSDLAARYGGEEFAVILPNTSANGAAHVSINIKHEIDTLQIAHAYSPISSFLTISIGAATAQPWLGRSVTDLIVASDKALYTAKSEGRNKTVCVFLDPLVSNPPRRL